MTPLDRRIAALAGSPVRATARVGGGCIAGSFRADLENGDAVFAKVMPGQPDVLRCEARGLRELATQAHLRVPRIIGRDEDLLLLEVIETGAPGPDTQRAFGRNLARMHRHARETHGFDEDNYIGASPQDNRPRTADAAVSWPEFYWVNRIEPQLRRAIDEGRDRGALRSNARALEQRLAPLLHTDDQTPSLLHGDLWSGNVLVDTRGTACVIDPAVYYGHREAELGMTHLFGGFGPDFYAGYEAEWPLEAGHRERLPAYILYHVLNHLNLFGGGYYGQAADLVQGLVRA